MKKRFLILLALAASPTILLGDSLWLSKSNNETSVFADRTATRVGDILTITVDETVNISTSMNKLTNESGSLSADVTRFFYPGFATRNGEYPSIDISGPSASHSGGGSITNNQTVSSSASVLVIDKLPNGNLIIEGARELTLSGETQYIVIRGVVRRDDIMSNNTVMSSKIAGAQVEFLDKGAIAASQKQGWIARLLNVANFW